MHKAHFLEALVELAVPHRRVRMGVISRNFEGKKKKALLVVMIGKMPPNPGKSFTKVRDYLGGLQGFPRANLTVSKT